MSSDQARREKTTIEKDRVPKMTTHFESLTERAKDSDIVVAKKLPMRAGKRESLMSWALTNLSLFLIK